jgi:hyaluronan synthase
MEAYQPRVHWSRQALNIAGCVVVFLLYRAAALNTYYPATVDLLISILLAEYCRFNNEGRRIAFRQAASHPGPKDKEDVEKQALAASYQREAESSEAIAAVVGWREDPALWARCLESYKTAVGCKFLLAGIDGHESDDTEMIDVFKKVRQFPDTDNRADAGIVPPASPSTILYLRLDGQSLTCMCRSIPCNHV